VSTNGPPDPLALPWRPSVDDVAALIRARTKDASGTELGTFTDQTRPTDAEVEQLITNGVAKVAAAVGMWDLPDECLEEGRHLAAILAACEAELSFWPEQVRSDRSPYAQLWALYQYDIEQFVTFVGIYAPAGTGGAAIGTIPTPSATVIFGYTWGFSWPQLSDVVNVGMGPSSPRRAPRARRR